MQTLGGKDFQDRSYNRGLADAGATGNDQDFLGGGLADGVLLAVGQFDFHLLLDPFQGGFNLDGGQWMSTTTQGSHRVSDVDFSLIEFFEIEPGSRGPAVRG